MKKKKKGDLVTQEPLCGLIVTVSRMSQREKWCRLGEIWCPGIRTPDTPWASLDAGKPANSPK